MSTRVLGSVLPDIGITKLKYSLTRLNLPCIDLNSNLYLGSVGANNNTISVRMNANPNGGSLFAEPGSANFPITAIMQPARTWVTKYSRYRPMGCKVTIKAWSQDEAYTGSNINQIAVPFTLAGFPCVWDSVTSDAYANQWSGTATGYTINTIPNLKYGFSRTSTGMGGKNMVKYTTYWDLAKIIAFTKAQYGVNDAFACQPDNNGVDPATPIVLVLALGDYSGTEIRDCTVEIKVTQYGKWEGQLLDFN